MLRSVGALRRLVVAKSIAIAARQECLWSCAERRRCDGSGAMSLMQRRCGSLPTVAGLELDLICNHKFV